MEDNNQHVLQLFCDDRPGIVAAVATTLSNNQCNIEESSQFNDHLSGKFYMRVVFSPLQDDCLTGFKTRLGEVAKNFNMKWNIYDVNKPLRALLLVSKHDHCLNDLLYRWRTKIFAV